MKGPRLQIRADILKTYPELFGDQTVRGKTHNATRLIAALTETFESDFETVLAARRRFLEKARYDFAPPKDMCEDVDGNRWTAEQIRRGMIDGFLGKSSPWRWRLNANVPIPKEAMKPGLQGTGPFDDLGMAMGALNTGAYGAASWMADWEDAGNDKWDKLYRAWRNLRELLAGGWDGRVYHHPEKNKDYSIKIPRTSWPVIFHRVPGIHLRSRQIALRKKNVPAIIPAIVIHTLNNYDSQAGHGSGIYFYIPKIETPAEALLVGRLLNSVEQTLSLPRGTIKIEMLNERARYTAHQELIMWVLRDWLIGPNVGRWDYMNSRIEMLKDTPAGVFPDPHTVGMAEATMTEYTRRNALLTALVGGFPVGGMAAVMKNSGASKDVNDRAVRSIWFDKLRERLTGLMEINGKRFDLYRQSWVATTEDEYVRAGAKPLAAGLEELESLIAELTVDEKSRLRALGLIDGRGRAVPFVVTAHDLAPGKLFSQKAWAALFRRPAGPITEKGLRYAIYMASEYMFQQLNGNNAAAIDDYLTQNRLMNDFATYEIFWHWLWTAVHHEVKLTENGESTNKGGRVTPKLMERLLAERDEAVGAFFAKQDREGVKSRFNRTFAPVTMDILRRQIFHPRWIMYGSRVLLSVIESDAMERACILNAIFSRTRSIVVEKVRLRRWPATALTAHDFVYDIFPTKKKRRR